MPRSQETKKRPSQTDTKRAVRAPRKQRSAGVIHDPDPSQPLVGTELPTLDQSNSLEVIVSGPYDPHGIPLWRWPVAIKTTIESGQNWHHVTFVYEEEV